MNKRNKIILSLKPASPHIVVPVSSFADHASIMHKDIVASNFHSPTLPLNSPTVAVFQINGMTVNQFVTDYEQSLEGCGLGRNTGKWRGISPGCEVAVGGQEGWGNGKRFYIPGCERSLGTLLG